MKYLQALSKKLILLAGVSVFISGVCVPTVRSSDPDLDKLNLPDGFEIEIVGEAENARSMDLGDEGTLFVGSRSAGNVYALVDENGDHRYDKKHIIAEGMNSPNGVAFRDGDLYVAEINRVLRYDNIEENLENPGEPAIVNDNYPTDGHHGWKYIAFGPDGRLHVPVGAPCNICEPEKEIFASITSIEPDGSDRRIIAHGVRNTVGFDWHPETGDLWFTDNGRDWMGDNKPPCELNHLEEPGQHFGYPYCHGGKYSDPKLGEGHSCDDYTDPVQNLGPHVAPLGMKFYDGDMFPAEYKNQVFIAEHGSWNRSTPIGYRITLVTLDGEGNATSYEPFIYGWLQGSEAWGRPVDVILKDDGSMLISDDHAGLIYRVTYSG